MAAPIPPPTSDLSPDAPIFVPRAPVVRKPAAAAPMFATYYRPPPLDVLPASGFQAPLFTGPPPPPPVFAGTFQGPPPPPVFPGPPPPPVFPGAIQGPRPPLPVCPCPFPARPPPSSTFPVPPFLPFPPVPGLALPAPMAVPRDPIAALPTAPTAAVQSTTELELPRRLEDAEKPAPMAQPMWRVASGRRPRPKPRRLKVQTVRRVLSAPASGTVPVAYGCPGEPSPRSVLAVDSATSPPDSPPVVRSQAASGRPRRSGSGPLTGSTATGSRPEPRCPAQIRLRRLFDPTGYRTTLMVRNIPNSFTRKKLMNILDQHCAEENAKVAASGGGVMSEYDFLYVPIDFKTNANKGYCFVNVTTPEAAIRLWHDLHGHKWKVRDCSKTCQVDYAARQGLKDMVGHFSGSVFPCDTEDFLPVWFAPPRNGARSAIVEQHVVGRVKGRGS